MKLKYQLPDFYQQLIHKDLMNFSPEEKKATCNNCAMTEENHKGPKFYKADLKCCTFEPFIPNFLVGAVLLDKKSQHAQKVINDKIEKRHYALPIGMTASIRYQLEFMADKENSFGQNPDWLCSYYIQDTGLCSLWKNRGVVCTSFYCKSSYGKKGLDFWNDLSDYLALVEMALMEEALVMLDFSPRQTSTLISYLNRESGTKKEAKSWVIPEPLAKELWNGYYNEQVDFYIKSYNIAANLNKKSLNELLGQHGKLLEEKTLKALDKIKVL